MYKYREMAYTYTLTFKPTGQRYYGVRYSSEADPKDLWVTYFSSSKIVHDLIDQHGIDAFSIQIDRIFDSADDAIAHEQKVLLEIENKSEWLNLSFGSGGCNHARIKTPEHRRRIGESNRKPKSGAALHATIANGKLGSEARRGQKDTEEVKRKRAKSVSNATIGKPKPWLHKKYFIEGKEFHGMSEIVQKYNVTRQTVSNRLKSDRWPDWKYAE